MGCFNGYYEEEELLQQEKKKKLFQCSYEHLTVVLRQSGEKTVNLSFNRAMQTLSLVRVFFERFALSSTDAPLPPLPSSLPPSLLLLPDAMIV